MKFTVAKAEAIYTGGGIYVFCGETHEGYHFLASDDPEWVMLTDRKTMTTELDSDEWNDRWYPEWQEQNCKYETTSDEEARTWLLAIYNHILNDDEESRYCYAAVQRMRDCIIHELEESPNAWRGYRMSNEELLNMYALRVVAMAHSDKQSVAEECQMYKYEILRRMEDFTGEIHE